MPEPYGAPTNRTSLIPATRPVPPRGLVLDSQGRPITSGGRPDVENFTSRQPGPGTPLVPALPQGEEPRHFAPPIGENLNYIPRSAFPELTPFLSLRALADSSDIVRLAIEDVIQQVVGLDWDVHPLDDSADATILAKRIERVKKFLDRPDRERSFKAWLTSLLEDCLVLDALTFYRQLDVSGRPFALVQIDGATITPLVDVYGKIPEAPDTGYQQIAYGRVETEFHRPYLDRSEHAAAIRAAGGDPSLFPTELVYTPRKPRVWSPYGQSPVERVIITVNLALRRQLHYLAYYTDGNIPEAFWKCPPSWEPHHIENMQDTFEKMLTGESGIRRRLRFMPGGEGAGLENPRGADEWKKEFDEYLARVVCYAFNTSPLPLVQLMNRATGEMADAEESHSGAHPLMEYVAGVITREIQEFLGEPELEFIWTEDKERDERLFMDKAAAFVSRGIYTRNEVRDIEGKQPLPGGDVATVDTAAGPVPLSDLAGDVEPGDGEETVPGKDKNPLDVPLPPAAGGGSALSGGEKAPAPGEGGVAEAARALDVPLPPAAGKSVGLPGGPAEKEDLRRWRKVAIKALLGGTRSPGSFQSKAIRPGLFVALKEWLSEAKTREDVEWAFRSLAKARRPLVSARRRLRLERKLRKESNAHFRKVAPDVAKLVANAYDWQDAQKLRKIDGPSDDEIDKAMQWDAYVDAVRPTLSESFLEGETLASDASGIEIAYGLTDEQATAYAAKRAAELVGKRLLPDGTVVDNPNARWAISKTTREKLRATIEKAFDEGWTQAELQEAIESPTSWTWRSDMIARTEVAFALNQGTVETYRNADVEQVEIVDGPGCLADGHDDSQSGVSGETWPLEKFEENPLGHPNCRRDAIPIVPEE